MSHFACLCGHVIRDQTDNLPYKAAYYADQDGDAVWQRIIENAISAVKMGWPALLAKAQAEYPSLTHADDEVEWFISGLVIGPELETRRLMYECEQCGRLWLHPKPNTNEYVSYLPETNARGVLSSHRVQTDSGE